MTRVVPNRFSLSEDGRTGVCTFQDGTSFLFDAADYDFIRKRKWYASKQGRHGEKYVIDREGNSLHRLLMGSPAGLEVDHIDKNPLNNKRENLRVCTHQQNQCNQSLQANNTSGYIGVSYYRPRSKYRARIKVSQKEVHLGYFSSEQEAIQARDTATAFFFGEFGVRQRVQSVQDSQIHNDTLQRCHRFLNNSLFV